MTTLELTQYNPVKAEVEAFKAKNSALVFLYDTPQGNKDARSHIYRMRQTKAQVEKVRKDAKAEALEYGRKVDAVAKELTADLDSMIEVHQKPLDEIDQRAAKAKAEAERIEREKAEAALAAERAEAARVAAELAAIKHKAEQDRLMQEAADRARIAAEQKAAKDKAESEIRERAAVEAQRKAEKDKQDAIIAAERAKLEAERQALAAKEQAILDAQRAAEQAEKEKAAAVQRAIEDAARKEREAKEAAERAERDRKIAEGLRAKQVAVRKGIIKEVSASLCNIVGIEADLGDQIAEVMLDGKIARVTVNTAESVESY